jgi:hypothetical protein
MRISAIPFVPLVVLTAALTACGGSPESGSGSGSRTTGSPPPQTLFSDDFKPACQGVSMTAAKPYDKSATTSHKILFFIIGRDDKLIDQSNSTLPQDWWVRIDQDPKAYSHVDLVVCAERTTQTFVKDCSGYKVKDKTSPLVVKWHTATYKVTVREAATGKELSAKEVTASDADCPQFYSIPADVTTVNDYAKPSEETIVNVAKPFVQP